MGQIKQSAKKIYGREPKTLDQVGKAVIKIIDTHKSSYGGHKREVVATKCVGLSWSITHSDSVSNSHSAPEGYLTNFGGYGTKDGVPRGYPGWTGRVWVRYENDSTTFGSDPFSQTLTHTGTGSWGSYDGPWREVAHQWYERFGKYNHKNAIYPEPQIYSWDFKIFDADWPKIEDYTHQAMLNMLEDKPLNPISHVFLWEDPKTKAADKKFLLQKY